MLFENKESFHVWATRSKAGKKHARAADKASEKDRIWFEKHPGQTEYIRPPISGEFPPFPGLRIDAVQVVQIRPGARLRHPLLILAVGSTR